MLYQKNNKTFSLLRLYKKKKILKSYQNRYKYGYAVKKYSYRMFLNFENFLGQGYDGDANISGQNNSVLCF